MTSSFAPALAAGAAIALGSRVQPRLGLLPRVLGLYIAIGAGAIQLLDIVVDRLALPDRLFFFAIVVALIGVPIVATVTLLFDVARTDDRVPRPDRAASTTLAARVELALSHQRMAELRRAAGAADEARASEAAFAREAERIIAELRSLMASEESEPTASDAKRVRRPPGG